MSWLLFIDESGQDQIHSPYEVLAGVAVNDSDLWPLIKELYDAQADIPQMTSSFVEIVTQSQRQGSCIPFDAIW